jgi:ferredoxin
VSPQNALAGFSRVDVGDGFAAKFAAMDALAALSPFEPVANVAYQSQGRLVVLADASTADLAETIDTLKPHLAIAVLWVAPSPPPVIADTEVVAAELVSLTGYFGAFALTLQRAGAALQEAAFDLVLDCRAAPAFAMHSPPQGYFHAKSAMARAAALSELPEMIGEFEKPKFFAYKASLCAHSRSKKTGCNKCVTVCSTAAISSDVAQGGDGVKVDAHLCMGCGACASVCPTGAMTYQYPRVADRGAELRAMLGAYFKAIKAVPNSPAPIILFHNATDGRAALTALATNGRGLPAHVLPLEAWHVASIGLDVMLGAIAYGAAGVALLSQGSEAPQYRDALTLEMKTGQAVLSALGYRGRHLAWVTEGSASLWDWPAAETVAEKATFHLANDKRATIEFAIEHLMRGARVQPAEILLPPGAMFGRVNVDKQKCTLCLACAGACPASALMDGADEPRLNFLERNCVQCGLCEKTCPENAITLTPRLLLTAERKQNVVLNESEPFGCISCGKALGTKLMIDNMLGKLAGHSMFQGDGKLNRLKMCADCRVVDMMSNKQEYSILTGRNLE